eukprot:jgi/Picsp_1/2395/NSC_05856-R1_atp synthase subunit d
MLRQAMSTTARSVGVMRTPGRAFAQKAVASEIDWDGISVTVQSDEGKRELASLRNTLVELERTVVASTGQEGSVPDWAKWKQILDIKIVENFEKAYASMKIPEYQDKEIANVKQRFDAIIKQAENISAASLDRVKAIAKELQEVEKEKEKLLTATVDEELANNPELAKQIDESNKNNSFLVQ